MSRAFNILSGCKLCVAAALLVGLTGCEIGELSLEEGSQQESSQPDYIVDQGYPPGCYNQGTDIVYKGRVYDRKVFKETVVRENIDNSRYTNTTENYATVTNLKSQPGGGTKPIQSGSGHLRPPPTGTAIGAANVGHHLPTHTFPSDPVPLRPRPVSPIPVYRPMPSLPYQSPRLGGRSLY